MTLLPIIESGLSPELTGDLNGIDAGRLPPGLLVAGAMDRAVMRAAERDGEFVACFAAERPWLQVAKMMRIGLFAAADETRLLGDITKVLRVTIAPRSRSNEHALIDAVRLVGVGVSLRGGCMPELRRNLTGGSSVIRHPFAPISTHRQNSSAKSR